MKNFSQEYVPDFVYHIYNHSSGLKNLFIDDEDKDYFLQKFKYYFAAFFDIYAFCLMPNHYHFAVRVKMEEAVKFSEDKEMSKLWRSFMEGDATLNNLIIDQFRRFHSSYALFYNNKHQNRGQLFLNRHKRISVDVDGRLKDLICYIHHNPIHHGFENYFSAWKYSSYLIYVESLNTIIDRQFVLNLFTGLDSFISAHNEYRVEKNKNLGDS